MKRLLIIILLFGFNYTLVGCSLFAFGGAIAQAHEDQMLIEKMPEYSLEGKTIAVVIEADLVMHYEHPGVSNLIAEAVAARIAQNVNKVRVVNPTQIAQWQYETPQWTAMPSTEIVNALKVDCVVYIQIQNYRLTPPGNQWLWEGYCAGLIGVIEAGSGSQDGFDQSYEIVCEFPKRPSVLSHTEASEGDISRGLLSEFIKQTSWLFYFHKEPKHPDRYRSELEA